MKKIKRLIKHALNAKSDKPIDIDSEINTRIKNFVDNHNGFDVKNISRRKSYQGRLEILIPCYNHGKFLEAALQSIVYQNYKKAVHVTFINDNSSDDSLKFMKNLKIKYESRRLIIKIINNKQNLLQAGCLNKAIINSQNELFMVLNADDILTKDCIDLTLQTYEKNKEIFMLGGSSLWFESQEELPTHNIKNIKNIKLTIYGPKEAMKFKKPNDINMSHSSLSFTKSAWMSVGGYYPARNERVCSHDDRDFEMRVCALMKIGVYEDYPMEYYRTDSSQGRGTL